MRGFLRITRNSVRKNVDSPPLLMEGEKIFLKMRRRNGPVEFL